MLTSTDLPSKDSLLGAEVARVITIAFFALFAYEWLLTLDEEVKYFWKGSWTVSRILFFLNRYVPFPLMMLSLVCFFIPKPTPEFCGPAVGTGIITNMGSLGIVQAILVLRVWYLFHSNLTIRICIIVAFVSSYTVSLYFAAISVAQLDLLPPMPFGLADVVGCQVRRPAGMWRLFFPSLLLHTLLYAMTAVRALRNRLILENAPVLKRLLRDGGFFFFVVFVSMGFTAVGSFLTQYPIINISVVFSTYLVAINSIAISRVLFSIHSLAENLGSDTAWLLSNAELSRVGWKKGNREGELIIERWSVDDQDDEEAQTKLRIGIKVSRVGVYGNNAW